MYVAVLLATHCYITGSCVELYVGLLGKGGDRGCVDRGGGGGGGGGTTPTDMIPQNLPKG